MKTLIRLFAIFLALFSTNLFAQDNSYEALIKLYSSPTSTGTARFQAIGGNHSALGADVSSASGNPAGLGFYTRSEFSFTPGYQSTSNSSVYAVEPGKTTNSNVNNFNIANIGVIFAGQEPRFKDGWRGTFGISYSRQNTLYNNVQFTGNGADKSSITDSYAEGINNQISPRDPNVKPSLTIGDLVNSINNAPNDMSSSGLYYWSFLVDETGNAKNPLASYEASAKVNQKYDFQSTGRVSQWNISYGGTANEKFYIGGTIGLPSFKYETVKNFSEINQVYKSISGFTDTRILSASGSGFNLSIGAIYKPNDMLRFGLNFVSPTWYDIDESTSTSLKVDVDPNKGINVSDFNPSLLDKLTSVGYKISSKKTITSIPKLSTPTYDDNYQMRTPLKLNGGAAIFFKKKGFVSADVEYVAYRGMNLSTTVIDSPIQDDLDNGNDNVKFNYKNVLNIKVGGEYRIGMMSLRGGLSYYEDPYSSQYKKKFNDDTNRSQMIYSAGIGYRTNQFYVDLTGLYGSIISGATPYRLVDTRDYASAKINNSYVKGVVSFGVFF